MKVPELVLIVALGSVPISTLPENNPYVESSKESV